MRILWVKIGGLWPLNMGGRLRSFHTIAELAKRHRVTVLTTHGPSDDPAGLADQLRACERVISIPYAIPKVGSARFAAALLRSWLSPYPVDLWKCRVPALRRQVHAAVAAGMDVCVADFLAAGPNVFWGGPTPTILFEHNVEYMIWKRLHAVERLAWRRILLDVEWRRMRRYEARACRLASRTIAVSEADRALLAVGAPGRRHPGHPHRCRHRRTSIRTAPPRRRHSWSSPDPWIGILTRMRSCISWTRPCPRSGAGFRASRWPWSVETRASA